MAILMGPATETAGVIQVVSICYTTDIPLDASWHQVDEIPAYPAVEVGKQAVMLFNTDTKDFTFVISDRPLSPDEEKDAEILNLRALLDDATNLLLETGGL